MSHATEAFEAAFSEADELAGTAFNKGGQAEAEASRPADDDSGDAAAQTS